MLHGVKQGTQNSTCTVVIMLMLSFTLEPGKKTKKWYIFKVAELMQKNVTKNISHHYTYYQVQL